MVNIKLEKLFLMIAIPLGILYIILILPNFKPDEDQHAWRAYDVSQGNLISGEISYPLDYWTYGTLEMTNYQQYKKALKAKTDYNNIVSSTSAAGRYYFMNYIPAALGIVVARMLGLNITIANILSRTMNYLLFLLFGYSAIRIMTKGKFIMFVYLLNPMVLYMASAISADSLINSFSMLFIAYALELMDNKKTVTVKQFVILLCLLWIPVRGKIVYFPLILLLFPILYNNIYQKYSCRRFRDFIKKHRVKIVLAILGIGSISYFLGKMLLINYLPNALVIVLFHPLVFGKCLVNTMQMYGKMYITSFSGGWLNWFSLENGTGSAELYLLMLFFSPFLCKEDGYEFRQRVLYFVMGVGMALGIFVASFVGWNDWNSNVIMGVQGRYHIPFIILLVLSMLNKNIKFHNRKYRDCVYSILLILVNLVTLWVNIKYFV